MINMKEQTTPYTNKQTNKQTNIKILYVSAKSSQIFMKFSGKYPVHEIFRITFCGCLKMIEIKTNKSINKQTNEQTNKHF